jgi:hypothetical protein
MMIRSWRHVIVTALAAVTSGAAFGQTDQERNQPRDQPRGGTQGQQPNQPRRDQDRDPQRGPRNPASDPAKERSPVGSRQATDPNRLRTTGRQLQLRQLRTAMDEELDLTQQQAVAVDELFKRQFQEFERATEPPAEPQEGRPVVQVDALRQQRREAIAGGDRQRARELSLQIRDLMRNSAVAPLLANDRFFADVRERIPEQQRSTFDDILQRSFNPTGTAVGLQGSTQLLNALRDVNLSNDQQTLVRSLQDEFLHDVRSPHNQAPLAAHALLEQFREDVLAELTDEQRASFFAAEERLTPPSAQGNAAMTFAALRSVRLADPQQGTVRAIRERFLQERRDARDPQTKEVLANQLREDLLAILNPDQKTEFLDAEARLRAELPEGVQPRPSVAGPDTGAGRSGATDDAQREREREENPARDRAEERDREQPPL